MPNYVSFRDRNRALFNYDQIVRIAALLRRIHDYGEFLACLNGHGLQIETLTVAETVSLKSVSHPVAKLDASAQWPESRIRQVAEACAGHAALAESVRRSMESTLQEVLTELEGNSGRTLASPRAVASLNRFLHTGVPVEGLDLESLTRVDRADSAFTQLLLVDGDDVRDFAEIVNTCHLQVGSTNVFVVLYEDASALSALVAEVESPIFCIAMNPLIEFGLNRYVAVDLGLNAGIGMIQ